MRQRQFAFNTAATLLNLLIHFSISFFLTSHLVETVGDVAYGFFTLANTVVNYALIVTDALNSMSARFIGYEVHNGKYEGANRFYSSVLIGDLVFAGIIFVPSCIAIYFLEDIVNIPTDLVQDVKILFLIVFINMCLNVVCSVFACVYTIKNRLDLSASIQTVSNIVKAILLIILYGLFKPSIVFLGTATLLATVVVCIGNVRFFKKHMPQLKLSLKSVKFSAIKEIVLSGLWNSLNQLSLTLLNGLDLLVTNLMVSAQAMGVLSLASTIPAVISSCISSLANLFTPKFLEHYSHNDTKSLLGEVKNSIRFMTVISCMPISALIAFGVPFFKLWVPDTDIDMLYKLTLLVILPQFSGAAIQSMNYLYTVVNKVKWQAIVLFICGVTNIAVVFVLLNFTSLGVYAIAGVSAVVGLIRNFCFNAPYAAHCIKQPFYIFWQDMFKSVLALGFCTGIGLAVNYFACPNTWLELILFGGGSTLLSGAVVALLILSREQKKALLKKLKH